MYAFAATRAKILFGRQKPVYTYSYRREIGGIILDGDPPDAMRASLYLIQQLLMMYHRREKRRQRPQQKRDPG